MPKIVRLACAVLVAAVIAQAVRVLTGLGGAGAAAFFDTWVYLGTWGGAVALCFARVVAKPTERMAWTLISLFMLMMFACEVLWTVWLLKLDDPPFPSIADALALAGEAFAFVGLITLLRSRLRSVGRALWLDGLVSGLTLAAVCAGLVFGPILATTQGDALTVVMTLCFPVLDLVLLCFVGVAFALTNWRPGRTWGFMGAGLVLFVVADAGWAYVATGKSLAGVSILSSLWVGAAVCFSLSAWQPSRREAERRRGMEVIAAPALSILVSLGILLYAPLGDVPYLAVALAGVALLVGGGRGWLALRENIALLRRSREEAVTDALSGLGNRRQLMRDVDDALGAAISGHPQTLIFFDLDGFKSYNDSFGHGAGDALLARLGARIASAVAGSGRAYRIGGDEFCVLFPVHCDRDDVVVAMAAAAFAEHGEGFSITASYGLVSLPSEAETASHALQLADQRMYAQKDSRRGSTRLQARDLLVRVLEEREPELRQHMGDVAGLATAVGSRMGLPAEGLDELMRAAELHDLGKVAVPDAVLHKPGPLDDAEWELMRQHSVIGERILGAAPAMRPVARLVRASHERFDGGGYPDGLAGAAIPLGARIIAVCDGYDAMVSDRPYRAAMTQERAIDELRRCAGTQFDPDVVVAFAQAIASRIEETAPTTTRAPRVAGPWAGSAGGHGAI
jgi:two-component system cell cycle response regulator